MRPSTLLTSAVFQLTPTRTRCELIIISNGKKEKIASGLINPFLAHLKVAQNEIAKGGYSILLEPESGSDATWFTKATMERFVRFVSTPEILERVYTVETEILQIEEAISIQSHDVAHNSDDVCQNVVENLQSKPVVGYTATGYKSMSTADEKAIIVYTPGAPLLEAHGPYQHDGNAKLQLLKVLENRKAVLQKEQGMAFARALAAGFDIDIMVPLIAFAECFGAHRLKDACSRFVDLWKRKHETGQWLDIQPSDAVPAQSDFSMVNASGIVLSDALLKHDDSNPMLASQRNGKLDSRDEAGDNQATSGPQECYQNHFPQLVYPPWPVHALPGGQQVFQAYPMQGLPYYQPFLSNPILQPNHPHIETSPSNISPYFGLSGQPRDTGDGYAGFGTVENCRTDATESGRELPQSLAPQFKVRGSNKKQSSRVVIQNVNYISSKRKSSGSEIDSDSLSEYDGESQYFDGVRSDAVHQNQRSSKRREGNQRSPEKPPLDTDEFSFSGKDSDYGDWQAFQECLLRSDENGNDEKDDGVFAKEKDAKIKRKSHSGDEILTSGKGTESIERNYESGFQFSEANGRKLLCCTNNEDFLIGSQNLDAVRNSSDLRDMNGFNVGANKNEKGYSNGVSDESLFVPFRSMSLGHVEETNRTDDLFSEIRFKNQKLVIETQGNTVNYEPNDLSLMPERGIGGRSSAEYNLVDLDNEMQFCARGSKERLGQDVNDVGALKKSERERKTKINSGPSSHKQITGGHLLKSKTLKSTPDDARARAERIRSYKTDMQRMKKEKEEAEMKRLELLKLERQKRIAARANSGSVKPSSLTSQVKQFPAKLSPAANRISKFSDSEPGSSSPLQRSKVRVSLGYSESNKAVKASKLSDGGHVAGNRLARSASSLSDAKRDDADGVTPEAKASLSRIKRLSEPKTFTNPPVSAIKVRIAEAAVRRRLPEGPDKAQSAEAAIRRKQLPEGHVNKSNVSAAINSLDRSKAESLPELKIRTSRPHVNNSASIVKDLQNGDAVESHDKSTQAIAINCPESSEMDADGNHIVEKTVLVLEKENPSFPTVCSSRGKPAIHNQQVKTVRFQQDIATPESCNEDRDGQLSSLEEPCTDNSNYGKAPQTSSGMPLRAEEFSCVKEGRIDHRKATTTEKAFVKESSKGLRRLLKFGKKNHASSAGDQSADSESGSSEAVRHRPDARKLVSSIEVHTLRRLISEDEASTAADNAPRKGTKHFSLLSPFRAKATEKKPTR